MATAYFRELRGFLSIGNDAPSLLGFDPEPMLPEASLQLAPGARFLEVMACHLRNHVTKRQLAGSIVPMNLPARRRGARLLCAAGPGMEAGNLPPAPLFLDPAQALFDSLPVAGVRPRRAESLGLWPVSNPVYHRVDVRVALVPVLDEEGLVVL